VTRPAQGYKQNADAMEAFKKLSRPRGGSPGEACARHTDRVWCQDEMRVGQKNKLTYRWARKGSRPAPFTINAPSPPILFGAVMSERGTGAALVLPACNSEAMQLHLKN